MTQLPLGTQDSVAVTPVSHSLDRRTLQLYADLFSILRSDALLVAALCEAVPLQEIDSLLQTIMLTLYYPNVRGERLALIVLQSLMSSRFESISDLSSLLKQNTALLRSLITYLRRTPGQTYLKAAIAPRVKRLVECDHLNLEISPVKVYNQMLTQIQADIGTLPSGLPRHVSADTAELDPNVQAIIAQRTTMLQGIADSFLSELIINEASVPHGIRCICKWTHEQALGRFPNASEREISSLIGTVYFTCLINPAIVTPHAYQLIEGIPARYPRRTLTTIARMFQRLVTSLPPDQEAHIAKLSSFTEKNQTKVDGFMGKLCEVNEQDTSSEDANDEGDDVLNITMNELYHTHDLLLKYGVSLPGGERLQSILDELGAAPSRLLPQENPIIQLTLVH